MKRKKLKNKYETFDLFDGGYMFAPNQIVVIRMANVITKDTVDVIGVVDSLSFDERHGSPTPIATVGILNLWRDGTISGTINIDIVLHRYVYRDPTEEEVKLFKDFENPYNLFYKEGKDVLIFPFHEGEEVVEC